MARADGGVPVVFLPLRSADFTSLDGTFESGCAEKGFDGLAETPAYLWVYARVRARYLYGVLHRGDVGKGIERMAE